jgi:uncharacterized repeat protein (TIGR03803 family)
LEQLEDRTVPSTITPLASFDGANGSYSNARLVIDGSGNLFGTTELGGAYGFGTVFEIAAGSGTITTLASFNGVNGANPTGSLVMDQSGNFFGTTLTGRNLTNLGTVFEVPAGSSAITTLAAFGGTNGANPFGGLTADGSGNLFGTTNGGFGPASNGTVFEVAAGSSAITTLAFFGGATELDPTSDLLIDGSGNLFGTTEKGGFNNNGIMFEVHAGSGTVSNIYSFNNGTGGPFRAGLVMDQSGNLFATTQGGNSFPYGTVIEKSTFNISRVAAFDGTNGAVPTGDLVMDSSGNLFGVAQGGGASGQGTVFEVAAGSGTVTTLDSFDSGRGGDPWPGLVMDSNGNLFGTTTGGGASGFGTVFEVAGASSSGPSPTFTSVVSSVNPSVFGQSVTFTCTVTPSSGSATPSGTVTFSDSGTSIGSAMLSGGQATFTTSSISVGMHSIVASYGGGSGFTGSTSNTMNQTVNKDSTTTKLTGMPSPSTSAQTVIFTATVTASAPGAGTPTGTVTFTSNKSTLATVPLDGNGQATFTSSTVPTGAITVHATYNGDGNFLTSTGTTVQTVGSKAASTITLASSSSTSVFGAPVTFTATVTGAGNMPTGVVSFIDAKIALATASLNSSGVATFTTSNLPIGTHNVHAAYGGNSQYNSSSSNVVSQTVTASTSTTVFASQAAPSGPIAPVRQAFQALVAAVPTFGGTTQQQQGSAVATNPSSCANVIDRAIVDLFAEEHRSSNEKSETFNISALDQVFSTI